jgi:hypothetical protein
MVTCTILLTGPWQTRVYFTCCTVVSLRTQATIAVQFVNTCSSVKTRLIVPCAIIDSLTTISTCRQQKSTKWRNTKRVYVLCAVTKHAGICQNTREVLRSTTQSGVLLNTFRVFWQIPNWVFYNFTQHIGQVFYFFYKIHVHRKPLRSFARAVSSYKARATANQIARNMSVILYNVW